MTCIWISYICILSTRKQLKRATTKILISQIRPTQLFIMKCSTVIYNFFINLTNFMKYCWPTQKRQEAKCKVRFCMSRAVSRTFNDLYLNHDCSACLRVFRCWRWCFWPGQFQSRCFLLQSWAGSISLEDERFQPGNATCSTWKMPSLTVFYRYTPTNWTSTNFTLLSSNVKPAYNLSVNQSVNLSVCLSVCLSI